MSVLTTFAAIALTGAALLAPAPTATARPREEAGYTVMDDYVHSLVFWHRNPNWGFPCRPGTGC
jgi:hypothetical protein